MTEERLRFMRGTCDRGGDVPAEHVSYTLGTTGKAECIALAARLGIVRRLRSRADAVAAIQRWVRAVPLAKEAIAY